jgi:hypothetical protein
MQCREDKTYMLLANKHREKQVDGISNERTCLY